MISLALKITGNEMHEENFEDGRIPICLVGARATFQISGMKFS